MADTYSNILFHIIFSTKNRRPWITPDIQTRLYDYIGGIVRNSGGVLYQIGGMPDHLRLLVRWNTEAIKGLTRQMKSESTKWIKQTFTGFRSFYWQSGGAIFSVSQSQAYRVTCYIQSQARHHKTQSFEEEYLEFLKKNGVQYDERYVLNNQAPHSGRKGIGPLTPGGASLRPGLLAMAPAGARVAFLAFGSFVGDFASQRLSQLPKIIGFIRIHGILPDGRKLRK